MKKTDNKGFSLVELIVVIAIMAVLVGVLAPALLRYVEKSRVATDNSALSEVASAIKTASANETIYDQIVTATSTTPLTVTVDATGAISKTENDLAAEVVKTVGESLNFKSKVYKKQAVTFTVTADSSSDAIVIKLSTYYNSSDSTDTETNKQY
jgi:type IV pilus assembly protein PilA